MSNVSSVNGASGVGGWEGIGGAAGLTPDALVAYCSVQLNGIDNEINQYEQKQMSALSEKNAVEAAEKAMNLHSPPQNQEQWDQMVDGIRSAEAQLPADDPVRAQLEKQVDDIQNKYCQGLASDPHYPSEGEWSADVSAMKDVEGNVSGQAEIQMIQLQSLVSQRATVVQLTTNMMSTMTQSEQAVAQKI
jgi:hypothetical protein